MFWSVVSHPVLVCASEADRSIDSIDYKSSIRLVNSRGVVQIFWLLIIQTMVPGAGGRGQTALIHQTLQLYWKKDRVELMSGSLIQRPHVVFKCHIGNKLDFVWSGAARWRFVFRFCWWSAGVSVELGHSSAASSSCPDLPEETNQSWLPALPH